MLKEISAVSQRRYVQNQICVLPGTNNNWFSYFTFRVKVFRGKKIHGEFDIKVEQVGFTYVTFSFILCSYPVPTRRTENLWRTSPALLNFVIIFHTTLVFWISLMYNTVYMYLCQNLVKIDMVYRLLFSRHRHCHCHYFRSWLYSVMSILSKSFVCLHFGLILVSYLYFWK